MVRCGVTLDTFQKAQKQTLTWFKSEKDKQVQEYDRLNFLHDYNGDWKVDHSSKKVRFAK